MAIQNDLAMIMQTHGKVAILPHEDAFEYEAFDTYEMTAMLALYTSFLREKKGLKNGNTCKEDS